MLFLILSLVYSVVHAANSLLWDNYGEIQEAASAETVRYTTKIVLNVILLI